MLYTLVLRTAKVIPHFHIAVSIFRAQYKNIQNSQSSQDHIFHSLQHFETKLHQFTKLRMFFPAVRINSPKSKVCLIGNESINRPLLDWLATICCENVCIFFLLIALRAVGLNDETPFTFANAIPGLEFHWTSSNIDVCKLKSVYEKVFKHFITK